MERIHKQLIVIKRLMGNEERIDLLIKSIENVIKEINKI